MRSSSSCACGPRHATARWRKRRGRSSAPRSRSLRPSRRQTWARASAPASLRLETSSSTYRRANPCASHRIFSTPLQPGSIELPGLSRGIPARHQRPVRDAAAAPRRSGRRVVHPPAGRQPLRQCRHAGRDDARGTPAACRQAQGGAGGRARGDVRRGVLIPGAAPHPAVRARLHRHRRPAAGCRATDRPVRRPDCRHRAQRRPATGHAQHPGFRALRRRGRQSLGSRVPDRRAVPAGPLVFLPLAP